MKLIEIRQPIFEIGNTSLSLTWQVNGDFLLTRFLFEDRPYDIQIHRMPIMLPELKNKRAGMVSFWRADLPDEESFSTTNDVDGIPVKVYSIVLNGVHGLFDDFDAFGFIVERRHSKTAEEFESKIRIDRYIGRKLEGMSGATYYEHQQPGVRYEAVVSKVLIDSDFYQSPRAEARKSFNPTTVPKSP
jgi:hypothetical protein